MHLADWLCGRTPNIEDDPPRDTTPEHIVDRLVDGAELARFTDDSGPPAGVELEDLIEILPRADDRANHGDALEDRLENREAHGVVSGKSDEHKSAVATQRAERLLERLRCDRERDGCVSTSEALDCLCRVFLRGVDRVVGAVALAIFAYCSARCPRPPMPKMATRSEARAPETLTALYVVTPAQLKGAASKGSTPGGTMPM